MHHLATVVAIAAVVAVAAVDDAADDYGIAATALTVEYHFG